MKKTMGIAIMLIAVILGGCGDTTNNVYGGSNSFGNKEFNNGTQVVVPNNIEINTDKEIANGDNDFVNENESQLSDETQTEGDSLIETEDNAIAETEDNSLKQEEFEGKKFTPFVKSSPETNSVIHADLDNWDDEDCDIFGRQYSGNGAMKLSVYNEINAVGGGYDEITAEVHIPCGERFKTKISVDFVTMKEMLGNGSYADVTIMSGEEEIYPSFLLESDTTDELSYIIDISNVRDLVIKFECHAVGNGFCGGIIISDIEE